MPGSARRDYAGGSMIEPSEHRDFPPRTALPAHEYFCIHSYAGEAGPSCGWRGFLSEAQVRNAKNTPRCPRCARATLMAIPSLPSDR